MSNRPFHFPVLPVFSVTEQVVTLEEMEIPYWNDAFAACFMLDLHHMGARPFRNGLWAMRRAWIARPSDPLVETPLYDQLLRAQDYQLDEKNTLLYANKDKAVSDFISEMANNARFEDRVPRTYKELRKDFSGDRTPVF